MLLCCLVAEDEPGPVMFDKHVEKSLKGFVNYFNCFVLKKYPMSGLCERRCSSVRARR